MNLSALLSRALVGFARDVEHADAPGGPTASIVLWSNLLRLFDDDGPDGGVPRRRLPALARLSTRAMKAAVESAERSGLVTVEPDPAGVRSSVVRLTAAGRQLRDDWRPRFADAEARWRARFGDAPVHALRHALERVVAQLDLELPHYVTGYGPADLSMVGASWGHADAVVESSGPVRGLRHGKDWRPVLRDHPADVAALSLSALLSQALTAFAIDYEQHGRGSLPLVAGVLAGLGDGPFPPERLPAHAAVNGRGTSLLERHGIVSVSGSGASMRGRLTSLGRQARDAYQPLTAQIEARWADRYGEDVALLRDALEALSDHLDPALPRFPVVRFVRPEGFSQVY
jgi:hypothetical protein